MEQNKTLWGEPPEALPEALSEAHRAVAVHGQGRVREGDFRVRGRPPLRVCDDPTAISMLTVAPCRALLWGAGAGRGAMNRSRYRATSRAAGVFQFRKGAAEDGRGGPYAEHVFPQLPKTVPFDSAACRARSVIISV
ncbi:hypothetical protein EVAR_37307_1 [Eumeta japonica]|uniref:Uncharacterized protein n=1 Tax=Eumeta variegata TaxID=151549 RepID=A0A4C1WZ83_EUMVA|nr:hypothetical protein EVAR_37307_1 [Eumeta japonica]